MAERITPALEEKFRNRLAFSQDIGIELFARDRLPRRNASITEKITWPKSVQKTEPVKLPRTAPQPAPKIDSLPAVPVVSLFDSVIKIAGDSLPRTLGDIGECTRCKLHRGRTKLVFGDGNPKADLVFVGEGPGRDEDAQGLPFVGRAGKLLTQMIEAMGLQRQDVYICNVVKCRPPEN